MFSPSFCPKCGSADLRSQLPPGDTHERLMCRGCGYIHYVNPKIIAGCIIAAAVGCRPNVPTGGPPVMPVDRSVAICSFLSPVPALS